MSVLGGMSYPRFLRMELETEVSARLQQHRGAGTEMGGFWEQRSGAAATARVIPRDMPTSRAPSMCEASSRNPASNQPSEEAERANPLTLSGLSPPKGHFSSIRVLLHQDHRGLRSTSGRCPCVCDPPSAGGQFGPIRSDPIKAGSANFILLVLNRLCLPFMLPCFS